MSLIAITFWLTLDNLYKLLFSPACTKYLIPFTHGISTSTIAGYHLFTRDLSPTIMTPFQHALMDFSHSYFIYDLIDVSLNREYLYVAHHTSIMVFMHLFKKYGYGKLFMQSLFLGEITNPFLNLWLFSKKDTHSLLFRAINHLFTLLFVTVRGLIMPWFFFSTLMEIKEDLQVEVADYYVLCFLSIVFNAANLAWMRALVKGYLKWLRQ